MSETKLALDLIAKVLEGIGERVEYAVSLAENGNKTCDELRKAVVQYHEVAVEVCERGDRQHKENERRDGAIERRLTILEGAVESAEGVG